MTFQRTIIGPVVTEKAERLKAAARTYTLWADSAATKVTVKAALEHFYDVEVAAVRVLQTVAKRRTFGAAQQMVKRPSRKKVLVTLKPKSKALDLSSFKNQ